MIKNTKNRHNWPMNRWLSDGDDHGVELEDRILTPPPNQHFLRRKEEEVSKTRDGRH